MAKQVDLAACDQEPIHLIGAVQPHGCLLAVDHESQIIEYASQNTAQFLGSEPNALLGQSLSVAIGQPNVAALYQLPLQPTSPELLRPWFISFNRPDGTVGTVECMPHQSGRHIVLEFLQDDATPAPVWEEEISRRAVISELVKPGGLSELAKASAKMIRDVTGFDRVMIYKFAEDKHGEVIAESTNRPDSFLGLHYPASDIPDPARRHFVLNLMRSIPDINCTPIPVLSASGAPADAGSAHPLDLTFSKLRAVAPVHVEYLNNMGVGASLSISLVTNNQLWGLVACHHYGKRLISSSQMRFAELLGGTTSALLQSVENTNLLRKSIRAEKTAYTIEEGARSGTSLRDLIKKHAAELLELIDAHSLRLIQGDAVLEVGTGPSTSIDLTGLHDLRTDGVATSPHFSKLANLGDDATPLAAGAALLDLSEDGQDCLVFLRHEYEQTINWAGKPEKSETTSQDGTTRLSPRGSFALWREERRGISKPFDAADRDALRILRRALFALNSFEREQAALEAQKLAKAEELRLRHALLEATRTSSMGELASAIAHELNQPLSSIANYVVACRQELKNAGLDIPEDTEKLIESAVREAVRAGDLVQRIRNFVSSGDLKAGVIDLNDAIRQGVDLALVSDAMPNLQVNLQLDSSLPTVFADPVQIGQVVLNLVRNAIKAMEHSAPQVLTISVMRGRGTVQVAVQDTGCGIAPEVADNLFEPFHASTTQGMGIGLSLCRSILEAHSGKIWVDPVEAGTKFIFELPVNEE